MFGGGQTTIFCHFGTGNIISPKKKCMFGGGEDKLQFLFILALRT